MLARLVVVLVSFLLVACVVAQDITVGASVRLVDRGSRGIPGHDSVGQVAVSVRLPSVSMATVIEIAPAPKEHWIKLRPAAGGNETWITTKYVDSVVGAAPVPAADGTISYRIGAWNLEHFGQGKTRGFPESGSGGPSLPPRSDQDLADLARTITQSLDVKLLALSEINGHACNDPDGDPCNRSQEIETLLTHLPAAWEYRIAGSGGSQRLAFLYDSSCVLLNEVIEIDVPFHEVQGKDIFARDPLIVHATLLQGGQPRNDLVVVAVHLASLQTLNRNHDRAMEVLRGRLASLQGSGFLGGSAERDILILGDMNANMFSPPAEQFFLDMDEADGPWDVLADPGYPATRLSGVPLQQRNSAIDYIIASRRTQQLGGLSGDEITDSQATVHDELIPVFGGADGFRRRLSDHLPVTVRVRVTSDTDN